MVGFAFPCDYFEHRHPDDLFTCEYRTAEKNGFPVMLVDYDEMRFTLKPERAGQMTVVWRGWQMTAERYQRYLALVERNGFVPLTDIDAYMLAHAAQNYIPLLATGTSLDIGFLPYPECVDTLEVRRLVGSRELVFVKDYVKSVFGHVCMDTGWSDCVLASWLEEIVDSRGDDFAGGLLFKEWCPDLEDEHRVFICDGQAISCGRHGFGTYTGRTPDIAFAESVALPSPFYTVDIAYSPSRGRWFVVECGDGQVSELPAECLSQFYARIRQSHSDDANSRRF